MTKKTSNKSTEKSAGREPAQQPAQKPAPTPAQQSAPKPAASRPRATPPKPRRSTTNPARAKSKKPTLLAGGNPQIPKGEGDAPVQAFIDSMPGWKREVGRRLDALIERTVPGVRKAVKWNTPFYGSPPPPGSPPAHDASPHPSRAATGRPDWFLAFHCVTKYVKVAFSRGASLRPLPPVASAKQEVRYLHIYENDKIDEAQLADWVEQASGLPGERM